VEHYIPKRRVPVTLWSGELQGNPGHIFLDLGSPGSGNQTILEKLNESSRFLPVAFGEVGQIHLVNRQLLTRVVPARQVIQSDIFARGFQPWREERAEVLLVDGTRLSGRIWMSLERETQRLSDFMNQQGPGFFVLMTQGGIHLVRAGAVVDLEQAEGAGAPLLADPLSA
jgi:hypothetical protein